MQTNGKDFGPIIQDYVRAKWGRGDKTLTADELGRKLDPALRERIDLLGVDDEKLLAVQPQDVISRIEALERDALREDSQVGVHKRSFSHVPQPTGRNSRSRRPARAQR
jgi:hypothetical protein